MASEDGHGPMRRQTLKLPNGVAFTEDGAGGISITASRHAAGAWINEGHLPSVIAWLAREHPPVSEQGTELLTAVVDLAREWGVHANPDRDPVGSLDSALQHWRQCYENAQGRADHAYALFTELGQRATPRMLPAEILRRLVERAYGNNTADELDSVDLADLLAIQKAIHAAENQRAR